MSKVFVSVSWSVEVQCILGTFQVSHYKVLENQLTKTLAEVEAQRHRLREREETVSMTQRQLAEERKRLERDGGQQVSQLRNECDARLEVER